jgi:hypothetical protein
MQASGGKVYSRTAAVAAIVTSTGSGYRLATRSANVGAVATSDASGYATRTSTASIVAIASSQGSRQVIRQSFASVSTVVDIVGTGRVYISFHDWDVEASGLELVWHCKISLSAWTFDEVEGTWQADLERND